MATGCVLSAEGKTYLAVVCFERFSAPVTGAFGSALPTERTLAPLPWNSARARKDAEFIRGSAKSTLRTSAWSAVVCSPNRNTESSGGISFSARTGNYAAANLGSTAARFFTRSIESSKSWGSPSPNSNPMPYIRWMSISAGSFAARRRLSRNPPSRVTFRPCRKFRCRYPPS